MYKVIATLGGRKVKEANPTTICNFPVNLKLFQNEVYYKEKAVGYLTVVHGTPRCFPALAWSHFILSRPPQRCTDNREMSWDTVRNAIWYLPPISVSSCPLMSQLGPEDSWTVSGWGLFAKLSSVNALINRVYLIRPP